MQLTEARVSGETENEAVGCQSGLTHRAISTKEILANKLLCVCVCARVLYKNSSERKKQTKKRPKIDFLKLNANGAP